MIDLALPIGVAFVVSVVGCRVAMALSGLLSFTDRPGSEAHKQHARAVPYGGGVAMAAAMAIAIVVATMALGTPLMTTSDGGRQLPILVGALALLALGLVDDRRPLPALAKLGGQIAIIAAAILFADLRVDLLREHAPLSIALALLWCVLITNAYNLLDHADGLSGTIALISTVVLLGASLMNADFQLAVTWLALIGALGGFLVWNLPPARIYMGDAGSMPLGFLLGAGCLEVTFWPSDQEISPLALLAPLLVSAIPLYDTAVVIAKRLRSGAPIMRGDRNHISHRLHRLGLGGRTSLAAVAALQTALAASALLLRSADPGTASVVALQGGSVLIAAFLLEAQRDRGT